MKKLVAILFLTFAAMVPLRRTAVHAHTDTCFPLLRSSIAASSPTLS